MFELGCTIIEGNNATIYLHPAFEKKEFFRGVSKHEVFQHEMVHFVRKDQHGDLYEESLAFFKSRSLFRRYFGAALRTPLEAKIFLAVTFSFWILFLVVPINFLLFFSYFAFGSFFFIRSARLHKKLQKLVDLLDSEHEGKGYDALIRMDEKSIKQRLKSIR